MSPANNESFNSLNSFYFLLWLLWLGLQKLLYEWQDILVLFLILEEMINITIENDVSRAVFVDVFYRVYVGSLMPTFWRIFVISGCCSFSKARCRLLIAVASLTAEPGLRGTWAYSLRHMSLVVMRHVESSWTRDWTRVPCIGRQILNHRTSKEVQSLDLQFYSDFLFLLESVSVAWVFLGICSFHLSYLLTCSS